MILPGDPIRGAGCGVEGEAGAAAGGAEGAVEVDFPVADSPEVGGVLAAVARVVVGNWL
jgi:hypothetical protein